MATNSSLGANLHRLLEQKGLSVSELTFEVNTRLPRSMRVSDETLRKWTFGAVPKKGPNPILVAAVADALNVSVNQLDQGIAADLAKVADLLKRL